MGTSTTMGLQVAYCFLCGCYPENSSFGFASNIQSAGIALKGEVVSIQILSRPPCALRGAWCCQCGFGVVPLPDCLWKNTAPDCWRRLCALLPGSGTSVDPEQKPHCTQISR